MIFARIGVAAVVATALVLVLGAGGPDPGLSLEAHRLVATRAGTADAALSELEHDLADAVASGREGIARTAAGDESPSDSLVEAAQILAAAAPLADRADRAVRALGAARVSVSPAGRPIDASVSAAELTAISAELQALATSADGFADIRRRAEGVGATIGDALDHVESGDLPAAEDAVARARADYTRVAEWESGPSSLPVWVETTGALLGATEDLVAAARAGDRAGVIAAARRVEALGDDAVFADRALRIAMSEGAAFVADGPLAALAEVERRTATTHEQVVSIMQTVGR